MNNHPEMLSAVVNIPWFQVAFGCISFPMLQGLPSIVCIPWTSGNHRP